MTTLLPTLFFCLLLPLAATSAAAVDEATVADFRDGAAGNVAVQTGGGVAEAVRQTLAAMPMEAPGELELTVLGNPDATPLAEGETLRIGAPAGRWPRARVGLSVQHWADGKRVRSRTVWVAVRLWREVDVYDGDFAAGTDRDALRSQRRRIDVAGVSDDLQEFGTVPEGRRLAHAVRSGRPLLAGDFEAVPDVVRGATVDVEVQRGVINLRTRGRALADGSIGDTISVALNAGRAPVNTRVISAKAVRIED